MAGRYPGLGSEAARSLLNHHSRLHDDIHGVGTYLPVTLLVSFMFIFVVAEVSPVTQHQTNWQQCVTRRYISTIIYADSKPRWKLDCTTTLDSNYRRGKW